MTMTTANRLATRRRRRRVRRYRAMLRDLGMARFPSTREFCCTKDEECWYVSVIHDMTKTCDAPSL